MKYTIYQITNTINNKIYIGKHQTENVNDAYFGSGVALKNSIKKYGREHFTKEILFIFDTEEEMNQKEKEIITEDFVKRNDTYNLGVGGEGGPHFKGKTHTLSTKEKLSVLGLGKKIMLSDVARQRLIERNKDITRRENVSAGLRGKVKTKEHKLKISESIKRNYADTSRVSSNKGKTCGSKNSQFGTMWITNGQENKKIKKDLDIPKGWYKGRI